MDKQTVFSNDVELGRLNKQNRIMLRCEGPIFRELFTGKSGLTVLDVGSNDGEKTTRWFSDPAVSRVLGLEYNEALAQQAQKTYGGEVFRFYRCDVEAEDFAARLEDILRRENIAGFDLIYMSFLLSHLKAPDVLLRRLRRFLRPGGVLVAVDSDDSACALEPEGGELYREYVAFFSDDPYCGNRALGPQLPELLRACGYRDPVKRGGPIIAGPEEPELRQYIYDTYALLEEDLPLLRANYPHQAIYDRMERWLAENLAEMKRCFAADNACVSMGITIVTAEQSITER